MLHLLERTDAKIVALDGNLSPNTLKDVVNYCIVKEIDSEFVSSLSFTTNVEPRAFSGLLLVHLALCVSRAYLI